MIKIIVDSACDLTQDEAKNMGVEILPLKTIFGTEEYLDGVTMIPSEFYTKLTEGKEHPTTSQIPPCDYEDAFARVKAEGDSAICITVSSKVSGCYQSATIALDGCEDCVTLVDSENVAIGQQLLVRLAVKLRDEGKTAREIEEILNSEKKKIRVVALLDTLEYLKKGGRISSAAAFAGGLLSIKPVIAVEDGELAMLGKARGSKNGQNLLREYAANHNIDYSKDCLLAYTGLSDELLRQYVADSAELHKPFNRELPVTVIGSTIGTHAGPGAIAVAFFEK